MIMTTIKMIIKIMIMMLVMMIILMIILIVMMITFQDSSSAVAGVPAAVELILTLTMIR